ncbi:2-hydroxymuconate tautomerase [Bacillus sp. B15-48]|uniref:2-hydroxymuconate tautomerase n=1 Tax=Bacillus sp. B15-48 TaxID=1548601 RepID=UPI00193FA8DE|nr:2-hydroxymuconate tautomerase [Bacillus sp. B15-48]MBM4763341.1 2-hydroxymuconate tautomerase family protein [Bacillus sp. B15-48]
MPYVQINLTKGRSEDQIERLINEVTKTVSEVADAPTTAIQVVVNEIELTHWGLAGDSVKKRRENANK